MSQNTFWSLAVLAVAVSFTAGCSQNRVLGRRVSPERDVVLAVQSSVSSPEPADAVREVSAIEDGGSDNWGTDLWNRIRPDGSRTVLPRTDFWHPGSAESTPSEGFDAGF